MKKVTIFGERCSGTNYLEQLLLINFKVEIIWDYGWKHFFGNTDLSNSDDVLFIGIIRNIEDWINSLYRDKYHLPLHLTKDIDTFLTDPFYSIDNSGNIKDKHIETNEIYKNIFELRLVKNKFLIDKMPTLVKNYYLITYDELCNNFIFIMNNFKKYDLEINNNINFPINIEYYKKNKKEIFNKKKNIIPKKKIINILLLNNELYKYEKLLFSNVYIMNFKSQAGEDKFLYEHLFSNKKNGTYIELGAMNGIDYSNTYFFEKELGWSGILIEPNNFNFVKLQQNRPNNYLFNNLISNITEPVCFRYFEDAMSGVSGIENSMPHTHFKLFFDSEKFCKEDIHNSNNKNCICWWKKLQAQGKINITPISLKDLIYQTPIKEIDLLSLDVEGHEYEVLQSWDFSIPINVILIETLGIDKTKDELCRKILLDNNYNFYSLCAHNEIYILNSYIYNENI